MRDFICPRCGQRLAFENSQCLSCGSALAYSLDGGQYRLCANMFAAKCNWLVRADGGVDGQGRLCSSCALARTRPNDSDTAAMTAFATAEQAKRRLVAELVDLKLPIVGREDDPKYGLAFDLLSSQNEKIFTGHEDGLITLHLAE